MEVPDLEHTFLVLTRTGLYGFDPENNWVQAIEFEGAGLATAMAIQPSNASVVAFAAQKAAWRCFQSAFTLACKSLPLDCSSDPTSVVVDAQQNVWIGADRLYLWTNTNKLMIPIHTVRLYRLFLSPSSAFRNCLADRIVLHDAEYYFFNGLLTLTQLPGRRHRN